MASFDILSVIYSQDYEVSECIKDKIFRQSHSKEFWLPDVEGLDVMHHAILAGNEGIVAVLNELLTESADELLESKLSAGYLHLAALLGNHRIVAILCEGPHVSITADSVAVRLPDIDVIQRYLLESGRFDPDNGRLVEILKVCKDVLQRLSDDPHLGVIDVAAMGTQVDCVRAILKSSIVQYATKCATLLERALDIGSLDAFRLLLAQNPDSDEMHSAFQLALGRKQMVFVASLLDHGVDVIDSLDGFNPYHFIYLCSPAFGRQRGATASRQHVESIDALTALFIERGFDVNACDPPGTFPLYSLLASLIQEKDNNPAVVPFAHIRSLDLLLRAGARTDVDEVRLAQEANVDLASLSADAGRELASSALNAYFYGLQGSDTWRPHISEHLDRLCLTLLEHGASATSVSRGTGSTALHDLMQATATQHAQGHMHADLSTMARMLLYFGADPNATNNDGQYAVEVYFSSLLRLMGGLIAFRRWKASDNAAQVWRSLSII
jgi:ankyrin repeat protein